MSHNIGVVGIGEVGAAVASVLQGVYKVYRKDLLFDEILGVRIEVLHVCIPYNEKFEKIVRDIIREVVPNLVIIHSTVAVGVTKRIFLKTKVPIVHSPVMGLHKTMEKDLIGFVKYVGPVKKEFGEMSAKHLSRAGMRVVVLKSSEETELGKLLDTAYYGWNIVFCKLVGQLCEQLNLDFENVYTKFNQSYNQGYKKTRPNVIRPVLKYHHERDNPGGGIGGHCVIENAKILDELYNFDLSKFIIRQNEKFKKNSGSFKKK